MKKSPKRTSTNPKNPESPAAWKGMSTEEKLEHVRSLPTPKRSNPVRAARPSTAIREDIICEVYHQFPLSLRESRRFVNLFVDLIIRGLAVRKQVRINGLGTFRAVEASVEFTAAKALVESVAAKG